MSYKKVIELGNKFAAKIAHIHDNTKFSDQKEQLKEFSFHLNKKLNAILNEMDGDFGALKEKKFDPNVLKVFKQTKDHLREMVKNISYTYPYDGALTLCSWAEDKHNKSILDNLNFIIRAFLKQNQESFTPGAYLQGLKVESISKLQHALREIKQYIIENPLLPDPRNQSTVPPPRRENIHDVETMPSSRETNIETNPGTREIA